MKPLDFNVLILLKILVSAWYCDSDTAITMIKGFNVRLYNFHVERSTKNKSIDCYFPLKLHFKSSTETVIIYLLWSDCQFLVWVGNRILQAVKRKDTRSFARLHHAGHEYCSERKHSLTFLMAYDMLCYALLSCTAVLSIWCGTFRVRRENNDSYTHLFVFWSCCHQLWQCLFWNITAEPASVA